jgi:hypothetical protein
MSYARADHAEWVQGQISYGKEAASKRKPKRDQYGALIGWAAAPDKLSDFQACVFDILGMVGGGIYNCPITWDTLHWKYGNGLSLIWRGGLATFDGAALTRLVFLCHEARIRCDLDPVGPRILRLSFWQRQNGGGIGERHPNLAEAVAAFREYLPADHRIIYREPILEAAE